MPGRSGRNRHSIRADLTETNLTAHRKAQTPRKQDPERWLAHVALPEPLRKKRARTRGRRPSPSLLLLSREWLGWLAVSVVGLLSGLLAAVSSCWEGRVQRPAVEGAGELAGKKNKRNKRKRWYR